jgi:hypothetical protein
MFIIDWCTLFLQWFTVTPALLKIALNDPGAVLGSRMSLYLRMVTLGGSLYGLHLDKGSKEILDSFLSDLTYPLVACTLFQSVFNLQFWVKKYLARLGGILLV